MNFKELQKEIEERETARKEAVLKGIRAGCEKCSQWDDYWGCGKCELSLKEVKGK